MLFETITEEPLIDPIEFFGVPLTRNRIGRLRLYPSAARSQVRSNFLTYRKELNLLIGEGENAMNMSMSRFRCLNRKSFL